MKETPKDGVYQDIPEEDYRAWDAWNFSLLKLGARSLAHAHYEMTNPSEPTPAMVIGSATHAAILEPDQFPLRYAAAPAVDKRTKAGKQTWEDFTTAHALHIALRAEEFDQCREMSSSVWKHPIASQLLKGTGINELSAVWTCQETKLKCKLRADRLTHWNQWSRVVDLKTTKDASPEAFAKDVANYAYYHQAAHYLDGLDALDARLRKFTIIAVEKDPPYCVAIYELDDYAIDQGREELIEIKKAFANAVKTDSWPGYPAEVRTLELPRWKQRREEWL